LELDMLVSWLLCNNSAFLRTPNVPYHTGGNLVKCCLL